MEIKINKEIRDYQESIIMGLSARQFLFSAAAVAAAVGVYFTLKKPLGAETVSWVSVLAAFPFAALGFVKYHGMTAEQFIAAYVKQQMTPKELPSMPDNTYALALEGTELGEVLKCD